MKSIILVSLLLITGVIPLSAQNDDNPLFCEGAQEWYDEFATGLREIVSTSLFYLVDEPSSLELQDSYSRFKDFLRDAESLDYPECVEWPRLRLLLGYENYLKSLEELGADNPDRSVVVMNMTVATLMVGNADGYLNAMGVETHTAPPIE